MFRVLQRLALARRVLPCRMKRSGFSTLAAATDAPVAAAAAGKKPRVIVISGPTGVGKSATAIALAERINGEIISCDSVQVYTHMDVGSAKVSASQRARVPHHLIDIRPPNSDFNAMDFYIHARTAVAQILDRGRVPIVCGGSVFYLRFFLYGPPPAPAPDPTLRARLNTASDAVVSDVVTKLLERPALDDPSTDTGTGAGTASDATASSPAAEKRVSNATKNFLRDLTDDPYRLRRALEIVLQTGARPAPYTLPSTVAGYQALDYDFRCFALTAPQVWLRRAIDYRCEEMISRGLIEEVMQLKALGMNEDTLRGRALGYRQTLEYISEIARLYEAEQQAATQTVAATNDSPTTEAPLPAFHPSRFRSYVDRFQSGSRQYAKRQLTSLRSEGIYQWITVPTARLPNSDWNAKQTFARATANAEPATTTSGTSEAAASTAAAATDSPSSLLRPTPAAIASTAEQIAHAWSLPQSQYWSWRSVLARSGESLPPRENPLATKAGYNPRLFVYGDDRVIDSTHQTIQVLTNALSRLPASVARKFSTPLSPATTATAAADAHAST